jgi:hypothetical protein
MGFPLEDRNTFREEILIELTDQAIRYVYFWGMPGGDFAERSGCIKHKSFMYFWTKSRILDVLVNYLLLFTLLKITSKMPSLISFS